MIKKVFACLLLLLLWLYTSTFSVFAESKFSPADQGQVDEALIRLTPIRFLPDNPMYTLIGIKEFFNRVFQPSSSQRAAFDLVLAGKRIKEAYMLLLERKYSDADRVILRYNGRLNKVVEGFQKARSQNQDVVQLVDNIAVDLKYHEWLLYAIEIRSVESGNSWIQPHLDQAAEQFSVAVFAINEVQPGLKDRYRAASSSAILKPKAVEPTSTPVLLFATPKSQPRKIIY